MMNERIEELADDCWEETESRLWRLDYQKFAKLIIQECVAVCNEFGEDVENGDIFESTEKNLGVTIQQGHLGPLVWRVSELMKERFGIVE